MKKVLVNGINAKSGGGESILSNFIKSIDDNDVDTHYFVLIPKNKKYGSIKKNNVTFIEAPALLSKNWFAPFAYMILIEHYITKFDCDVVFNLGDIIINTRKKQIYLFDWAYAVYDDPEIWDRMALKGKLIRKFKCWLINRYIDKANLVIAQTEVTKKRLENKYQCKNVHIVPNAVSVENFTTESNSDFKFDSKFVCLYLTHYYQHKNIEIFLELAKEIKRLGLDIKIVTTLDAEQDTLAKKYIDSIEKFDLGGVLENIGSISMDKVPELYRSCDSLLMPTLLESFSGTYVEALYHGKVILTSDRDFARQVCGDAALYFDPQCVDSIIKCLLYCLDERNQSCLDSKIKAGKQKLEAMPTWDGVSQQYIKLIKLLA